MLFRGYLVRYFGFLSSGGQPFDLFMVSIVFIGNWRCYSYFIKGLLLAKFSLFSPSNLIPAVISANESLWPAWSALFHRILVFLVKNGLTHVGGGFSASVGEFHSVPVKKEGRRCLGR